QRLTSAAGVESRATISPDGTTVAYAGVFDGNTEVFVLPMAGGTPRRLTFHPGRDLPVAWMPDGSKLLVRSDRSSPHGDFEYFLVPAAGGALEPVAFGPGGLGAFNRTTGELAFNPQSNETWYWKGYRGGTAPDVWKASPDFTQLSRVTKTESNELFPMWIGDRVWFLGDDDGRYNLWSCKPDGSDRTRHSQAGPDDFDLRWASADASGAPRIVFTQGADVFVFDASTGKAQRVDLALRGDRLDSRQRVEPVGPTITQLALSPDAKRLALISRGEVLVGPVGKPAKDVPQAWQQVQGMGDSREAGVFWMHDGNLLLLSDRGGEASIVEYRVAALPTGAKDAATTLFTADRWIFAPVASPDGALIAFGDKSMRMNVLDVATRTVRVAGASPAGEVTDYRFSRDGRWLAWMATLPNGFGEIHIYDTRESLDRTVSSGRTDDRFPRWDPKGTYLYFCSARAINPELDQFDLSFVTRNAWQFFAVPLQAKDPPPLQPDAAQAGVDLAEWANASGGDKKQSDSGAAPAAPAASTASGAPAAPAASTASAAPAALAATPAPAVAIDFEGFMARASALPSDPGTFRNVEATFGGLVYLRVPQQGVSDEEWPPPVLGPSGATLERLDLVKGSATPLVDYPVNYVTISGDCSTIALATMTPGAAAPGVGAPAGGASGGSAPTVVVLALAEGAEPQPVPVASLTLNIDIASEWAQIFDEAWRLQRDFFWKPDLGGVDWQAVRARYAALLPRIGSRQELNDLVG
ncbi:MAG: PD40 domain-containing protein, partial [Phycisphaerae bacterium]|nr:PD40 domain-containing protein [Phycisphaerae bacterium]